MTRRVAIGCMALLLAGMAAEARAELVIYAQDTTVNQGGYALLNLYIAGLTSDAFADYQVTLEITPNPGASGTVAFAPNGVSPNPGNITLGEQPYNYLFAGPNYIFAGDSLDVALGVNGGGYPTGFPSTFFSITDLTISGVDHHPSSSNPPTTSDPGTLLGSLLIHAVSTNPGGAFSVSLVSNGSGGNGDTFFLNAAGAPVAYQTTLGTASGFSGSITIGTSAVPEPAAIVSGMTGVVMVAGFLGFRRIRRSGRASA